MLIMILCCVFFNIFLHVSYARCVFNYYRGFVLISILCFLHAFNAYLTPILTPTLNHYPKPNILNIILCVFNAYTTPSLTLTLNPNPNPNILHIILCVFFFYPNPNILIIIPFVFFNPNPNILIIILCVFLTCFCMFVMLGVSVVL